MIVLAFSHPLQGAGNEGDGGGFQGYGKYDDIISHIFFHLHITWGATDPNNTEIGPWGNVPYSRTVNGFFFYFLPWTFICGSQPPLEINSPAKDYFIFSFKRHSLSLRQ